MRGVIIGIAVGIIAVLANIIINGIHSSYVYYSNYLFLSGILMGLVGGAIYISYWFTDRRIIKKIIINEELPEKRSEIEYMSKWGNNFIIASAILILLSLLVIYL